LHIVNVIFILQRLSSFRWIIAGIVPAKAFYVQIIRMVTKKLVYRTSHGEYY